MSLHVELEHNPFIKWVSYVDPNMTTLDFATRDLYRGVRFVLKEITQLHL